MQRVTDYELIDHGIEHPQYFQGCGTAYTSYRHVVTGIGDNPAEAIDDCLDQIAMDCVDAEVLEKRILADEGWEAFPTTPSVYALCPQPESDSDRELYYHVSIRYNTVD